MERVERLVRTWAASGRDEEVRETVAAITSGEASMLDVVKALGEYLTSEDDGLRTKGVDFLSTLIQRCPPETVNRNTARVLTSFMCSKLEDTETVVPALCGLSALAALPPPAFSDAGAVEVAKALFSHVKMRALVQAQRFVVFTLVDRLVAAHRQALTNLGAEFLDGYVALAEGEKDPRNLLLAFAIARVLLIEFDVSHHIEQIFNITFCYFPITFRPPPDDPYGITTEDLKQALKQCLSATPAFGPLAVPLFLEKLTAGSPVTKRDTLQTLDICLPVYGPLVARDNAKKLWNMLRLEIFQPTDLETENMALHTTQVLIQTIYSIPSTTDGDDTEMEGLAKDACDECIRILKEPEKSQAKPAIKVLCAFMATTPSVSRFTLAQAVPHLVKLFLDPDEVQNRGAVLQLLADLVGAARTASTAATDSEGDAEPPLAPYKDEVLGVLTVGLKVPSGCRHALEGLLAMADTPALLTDEELGFVVHSVNEVLTGANAEQGQDEDISDAILALLTRISATAPRHVSQTTLPLLFGALPDAAPARDAESARLAYWRTLAFLKRLCVQPDLFETLVVRLSTKLDLLCEHQDAFAKKAILGHVDVVKYLDRLVPRLFNLHFCAVSGDGDSVAAHPRLVAVSAEIVTIVVQAASAQRQEVFLAALFAAYFEGDVTRLAEGQHKIPEYTKFYPFSSDAPSTQKNLVVLFSAAIVALHKEVALPVADESELLERLLLWSINDAEDDPQLLSMLHCLASVVNKRIEGCRSFLTARAEPFWSTYVAAPAQPPDTRRRAIAAWTWITKALLTRGDTLAQSFTDRLFTLFDDPVVGWDAARAVGAIVSQDQSLTKKNHAVIKFLFAQRFSNTILPRLIDGAKSSSDRARQNAYLVALASLIKSIPKTVYAHQLPVLLPLLLRGLDLPDHEIRANVINTLLAVADTTSKENNIIAEHATSLVNIMLRNSMAKEMPSIRVRCAALQYLAILPKLVSYDVVHPQKATVLRELAKALDDPKKSVRREAVEARTNW